MNAARAGSSRPGGVAGDGRETPPMTVCPLCGGGRTLCERTIETSRLREQWLQRFKIDIAADLGACARIDLHRCACCGLGFFVPPAAGSARLYAQLQQQPWYYQEGKWEHGLAERRLARSRRVLEIGCGSGAFLQRLRRRGIEACGLEMNPEAIADATARGLDVSHRRLEDAAAALPPDPPHAGRRISRRPRPQPSRRSPFATGLPP